MAKKYCYLFTEGNADMRELLGGKGANLAEMTNIGLPVPQGFTISTEACTQYYEDGRQINPDIQAEINVSSLSTDALWNQSVEISNLSIVDEEIDDCWIYGTYKAEISVEKE
jgi:phosphoenolpyruvate synthase/pyruvate phosphate dikinase